MHMNLVTPAWQESLVEKDFFKLAKRSTVLLVHMMLDHEDPAVEFAFQVVLGFLDYFAYHRFMKKLTSNH